MATAAIGIIAKLGLSELTQHTARLKGAVNENAATDQLIPAYDADLKQIGSAYTLGQATAADCYAAIAKVNSYCYTYLKAQTGKPGTAWLDRGTTLTISSVPACNKACTVGCCVYYNDLNVGLYNLQAAIQTEEGFPTVQNDGHTGPDAYIPEVYPPSNKAYGNYARPSYHIVVSKPPITGQVQATITSTIDSFLGNSSTGINLPVTTSAGTVPSASAPNTSLLFLGVGVVGLAVLFALLFK